MVRKRLWALPSKRSGKDEQRKTHIDTYRYPHRQTCGNMDTQAKIHMQSLISGHCIVLNFLLAVVPFQISSFMKKQARRALNLGPPFRWPHSILYSEKSLVPMEWAYQEPTPSSLITNQVHETPLFPTWSQLGRLCQWCVHP